MELFKRLKVGTAVLLMLGISLMPAYALFPDIDVNTTTYYDAIVYLEGKDVVVGYSDGTFRPETNISRAEFTKIIIESRYSDTQIASCTTVNFEDVEANNPHRNHICVAEQNNVVDGYSDGEFKPDVNIEADQAAKVVVNSYGIGFGQNSETDLSLYVDQLKLRDAWPSTITENKQLLKRNEMAQIIYRLEVKTAFQTVVDSSNYDSLEAAVKQAELESVLRSESEYTLFAPNDAAFAAVNQTELNLLLTDNSQKDNLRELLLNHTVEGRYTKATLLTMNGQTLETEGGEELTVNVDGANVTLTDEANTNVMIIGDGAETSNGVVFEVNGVLAW